MYALKFNNWREVVMALKYKFEKDLAETNQRIVVLKQELAVAEQIEKQHELFVKQMIHKYLQWYYLPLFAIHIKLAKFFNKKIEQVYQPTSSKYGIRINKETYWYETKDKQF